MERRRGQVRDPRTQPRPDVREERVFAHAPELRVASDGSSGMTWGGHAVVYDSWTLIYDYWYGEYEERIAAGACTESIGQDDIRALFNHDANYVLGRSRCQSGDTLRLSEDSVGVVSEGELPDTTAGRDVAALMRRGDVSGMSFAFEALAEEWAQRPDGVWQRTVTKLRLFDVSPVTYPAYIETDAAMRSWLRAGRRNSASDEAVIRGAVDSVRGEMDSLEGLIASGAAADSEEEKSARAKARAADEGRRHRATAAYLGLTA